MVYSVLASLSSWGVPESYPLCSPWNSQFHLSAWLGVSVEVLEIKLHGEESFHPGPTLDICRCQALVVKNPPANAGDVGLISGSERFP